MVRIIRLGGGRRAWPLEERQSNVSHGIAGFPDDHGKVVVQPTKRDLIVGQNLVEGEPSITFARDGEESDHTVVMQLEDRILNQVQGLSDGGLHGIRKQLVH